MGGKVASSLFALPPVLPKSGTKSPGSPLVVVLLAAPLMLLGAGSLERPPLMLELATIIAPSNQVGFSARWY